MQIKDNEFDVILVGSGTGSSVIAKDLARQNKKVLILEKGSNNPLKDNFLGMVSVAKEHLVGDKLKSTCAVTVGGSTGVYFGVCKLPSQQAFADFGIDLSEELKDAKKELPLNDLPDKFLSPQTIRFMDSAEQLGYPMAKNPMLVDFSQCHCRYSHQAKWKAREYIEDAISHGADLMTKAQVHKIIVENNKAVGVEYTQKKGMSGSKNCKVYGKKIVLGAGAFSTPKLLMDCGIKNIGNSGFFCKPSYMVFGTVPGMKGKDSFVGGLSMDMDMGVSLGDGTMTASLFRLVMLSDLKFRYLFSHATVISAGLILYDSISGELKKDGSYYKKFTDEEYKKLKESEAVAKTVLEHAGAENIATTNPVAGIPGGVLKVGEHVDNNLQTEINNLFVCDHSLMSDTRSTPTIFLICLGKYLSKHLSASVENSQLIEQALAS